MRRTISFLLFAGLFVTPLLLFAQEESRDYAIVRIDRFFTNDNRRFVIEFVVENLGASATNPTQYTIFAVSNPDDTASDEFPLIPSTSGGRVFDDGVIDPIPSGESITIRSEFDTSGFESGTVRVFKVEAGIDAVELAGTAITENNSRIISVRIPDLPSAIPSPEVLSNEPDYFVPLLNIPVSFVDDQVFIGEQRFSRAQLMLGGTVGLIVLMLIIITGIILRLLFRGSSRFALWRPPYVTNAPFDPNTLAGRRQAWQHHAQNGSILIQCAEGAVYPVKKLLDLKKQNSLANWKITGMRISQYDVYGRLGHSQVVAGKKLVKEMNMLLHNRHLLEAATFQQQSSRFANELINSFQKKVNERNAMLPIALDIRFEGKSDEVAIQFELYQCHRKQWQRIDAWEPETTIPATSMEENYTYTLHGQRKGETRESFFDRLRRDIEWVINEMMQQKKEDYNKAITKEVPPDTLTMKPMTDEEADQLSRLQNESSLYKPYKPPARV